MPDPDSGSIAPTASASRPLIISFITLEISEDVEMNQASKVTVLQRLDHKGGIWGCQRHVGVGEWCGNGE